MKKIYLIGMVLVFTSVLNAGGVEGWQELMDKGEYGKVAGQIIAGNDQEETTEETKELLESVVKYAVDKGDKAGVVYFYRAYEFAISRVRFWWVKWVFEDTGIDYPEEGYGLYWENVFERGRDDVLVYMVREQLIREYNVRGIVGGLIDQNKIEVVKDLLNGNVFDLNSAFESWWMGLSTRSSDRDFNRVVVGLGLGAKKEDVGRFRCRIRELSDDMLKRLIPHFSSLGLSYEDALNECARRGKAQLVQWLLTEKQVCEMESFDEAFKVSVKENHFEVAKMLVDAGKVDLNKHLAEALHQWNRIDAELVKFLLEMGADSLEGVHNSEIYSFGENWTGAILPLLLEYNVRGDGFCDLQALRYAVSTDRKDWVERVVEGLDSYNQYRCVEVVSDLLKEKKIELAQVILKKFKISYNAFDGELEKLYDDGYTKEYLLVVKNLEHSDESVGSLWEFASKRRAVEVIEFLLFEGVGSDESRANAFSEATRTGDSELVELFLRAGVDPSFDSSLALSGAVLNNDSEMQMELVAEGASMDDALNGNMLIASAAEGNLRLVQRVCNVNKELGYNAFFMAILHAVKNGRGEVIEYLIKDRRVDLDRILTDVIGELMFYRDVKFEEGAQRLIKRMSKAGARVTEERAMRVIQSLFVGRDLEKRRNVIKILLDCGMDPRMRDSRALALAMKAGMFDMVKLLVGKGGRPEDMTYMDYLNALAYYDHAGGSDDQKQVEILEYVVAHGGNERLYKEAKANVMGRQAVAAGALDVLKKVMDSEYLDEGGRRELLEYSCEFNNGKVFEWLVEHGVSYKSVSRDRIFEMLPVLSEGFRIKLLGGYGIVPDEYEFYQNFKKAWERSQRGALDMLKARLYGGDGALSHLEREAMGSLLQSDDEDVIIEALHYLIYREKSPFIIGMSNKHGQWTNDLGEVLIKQLKREGEGYIVNLTEKVSLDENLLKHFSGLVNPGAGDTYPTDKREWPFDIGAMDKEKMRRDEYIYQRVLDASKKYGIPYLGICAGMQHMILNNGGKLTGGVGGASKARLRAGTVSNFMALTDEEKARALNKCELKDLEFGANYAHSYAGETSSLGEGVQHGGESDLKYVVSASKDGMMFGFQFHPEQRYEGTLGDREINRSREILDSYFKLCESYHKAMKSARAIGLDVVKSREHFRESSRRIEEKLKVCARDYSVLIGGGEKGQSLLDGEGVREYYDLWDGNGQVKASRAGTMDGVIEVMRGINPEDVLFYKSGDDLVIYLKKERNNVLELVDHFKEDKKFRVRALRFANGYEMGLGNELYGVVELREYGVGNGYGVLGG